MKIVSQDDITTIQVIGIGKYGHHIIQQIEHCDNVQFDVFECDGDSIDAHTLCQCFRDDVIKLLLLDPAEKLCHSLMLPCEIDNYMFMCYPKSEWDEDSQNCFKSIKQNVIATYDICSTKEIYHNCCGVQKCVSVTEIQALSMFIQLINRIIMNSPGFVRLDLRDALSGGDITYITSSTDDKNYVQQVAQAAVNACKNIYGALDNFNVRCHLFLDSPGDLELGAIATIVETIEDNLTSNDNDVFVWGYSTSEDNGATISLLLNIKEKE